MAIALQAGFPVEFNVGASDTVHTLTGVTVAAGANTVLVVSIGFEGNAGGTIDVTGVTYNSDALTFFGKAEHANFCQSEIWYRVAPDVATGDVVVTLSSASECGFGVLAYNGVSQSSPWRSAAAINSGSSATNSTVTPTGVVTGDVLVDELVTYGITLAPGADQTERWYSSGTNFDHAGSTQNGVDGGAMSWTWGGGSVTFSHVAGALQEGAGASLASDTPFRLLGRGAGW